MPTLAKSLISINTEFSEKDWELYLGCNGRMYVSAIHQYLRDGLGSELNWSTYIWTLKMSVPFLKLCGVSKWLITFQHAESFSVMRLDSLFL